MWAHLNLEIRSSNARISLHVSEFPFCMRFPLHVRFWSSSVAFLWTRRFPCSEIYSCSFLANIQVTLQLVMLDSPYHFPPGVIQSVGMTGLVIAEVRRGDAVSVFCGGNLWKDARTTQRTVVRNSYTKKIIVRLRFRGGTWVSICATRPSRSQTVAKKMQKLCWATARQVGEMH